MCDGVLPPGAAALRAEVTRLAGSLRSLMAIPGMHQGLRTLSGSTSLQEAQPGTAQGSHSRDVSLRKNPEEQ